MISLKTIQSQMDWSQLHNALGFEQTELELKDQNSFKAK